MFAISSCYLHVCLYYQPHSQNKRARMWFLAYQAAKQPNNMQLCLVPGPAILAFHLQPIVRPHPSVTTSLHRDKTRIEWINFTIFQLWAKRKKRCKTWNSQLCIQCILCSIMQILYTVKTKLESTVTYWHRRPQIFGTRFFSTYWLQDCFIDSWIMQLVS